MTNFQHFFKLHDEKDKSIVGMYLENPKLKIEEIAQRSKKSIGEIYRILKANHIKPNRLKENHKKVESLSHLGWSSKEIANLTGYSERNVRNILRKNNGSN